MKRKSVSKKVRFEIFKRDCFTCQYCGRTPPTVVLVLDHIVPVKANGPTDPDNLVTACFECNAGKGARDLKAVPESLSERAAMVAEKEAQLLGYQSIMEARRQRIDDEMWRIAEILEPGSSEKGMRRDQLASVKMFIDKLGLYPVLDLAELAASKNIHTHKRIFLYFCACCWRAIKGDPDARA